MVKINGGDDDKFRLYQSNNNNKLNNVGNTTNKNDIKIPIGANVDQIKTNNTTTKTSTMGTTDAATKQQIEFLENYKFCSISDKFADNYNINQSNILPEEIDTTSTTYQNDINFWSKTSNEFSEGESYLAALA